MAGRLARVLVLLVSWEDDGGAGGFAARAAKRAWTASSRADIVAL